MVRVPRGLHSPVGSYAPNRLGWGPVARPIRRLPIQLYRTPVTSVPLVGGQGQTTVTAGTTTGTPIKVVQSKVIANALSGSFSTATTAGNCVIVVVVAFNAATAPNVSGVTLGGSAGNFAQATSAVNAAATFLFTATWTDPSCAGGQTAIVVSGTNLTVSAGSGIVIMEVSGLAASSVVDRISSQASNSSAAWSSATSSVTTQAYELWVGAASPANASSPPGSPWTTLQFGTGGSVGYQIVTAEAAATYAGSQSPAAAYGATVVTLFGASSAAPVTTGAGLATISVGPQGLGNVWYPASVTVQTTTGVNDFSTCNIYLGPAGVPIGNLLQATIFPGGIGTASLAIPSMTPGQYVIAQWTGGNPGDIATMNVTGTMDSVMP